MEDDSGGGVGGDGEVDSLERPSRKVLLGGDVPCWKSEGGPPAELTTPGEEVAGVVGVESA